MTIGIVVSKISGENGILGIYNIKCVGVILIS